MQLFIGIWAIVASLVLLNGVSAGLAAALHVWRNKQSRRSRVLLAAAISGFAPILIAFPALVEPIAVGSVSVVAMLIGTAFMCGAAMAVSLPGAVVIARKLDGPGDAYQTFE